MSSNAEWLAAAVRTRREELDLSQLDVWQRGGPSNTTLTEIENGRTSNLTRTTARKLDAALQWAPGSAKAVWAGGEPTPLAREGMNYDELEAAVRNGTADEAQRAAILALIEQARSGYGQEKRGESA